VVSNVIALDHLQGRRQAPLGKEVEKYGKMLKSLRVQRGRIFKFFNLRIVGWKPGISGSHL
jgi:hypothetical protein